MAEESQEWIKKSAPAELLCVQNGINKAKSGKQQNHTNIRLLLFFPSDWRERGKCSYKVPLQPLNFNSEDTVRQLQGFPVWYSMYHYSSCNYSALPGDSRGFTQSHMQAELPKIMSAMQGSITSHIFYGQM